MPSRVAPPRHSGHDRAEGRKRWTGRRAPGRHHQDLGRHARRKYRSSPPKSTGRHRRGAQAGLRAIAHLFDLEDAKGLVRAGVDAFAHGVRDRDIDDEFVPCSSAPEPRADAEPPGARVKVTCLAEGRPRTGRVREAGEGERRRSQGAGFLRHPGAKPAKLNARARAS